MCRTSCRTSPRSPPESGAPLQVHPRRGRLSRQDPQHLQEQMLAPRHPPPPLPRSALSVTQVCPCSPGTSAIETKTGRMRKLEGSQGRFPFLLFKLTWNGCMMFRSAKAEVPGNGLPALAASGHTSSASPSTHLLHLRACNSSL
jgi:hypothetical protein